MQRDLDSTIEELNFTRNDLHEKEQLLRNRDTLLESTGLQVRQSTEALERERQLRRLLVASKNGLSLCDSYEDLSNWGNFLVC